MLRVHSDPIAIIAKVLEQNPKSYTRIQDFEEVGKSMFMAGLVSSRPNGHNSPNAHVLASHEESNSLASAEKRVTALCIEAALREDDFETAYSFVVNRLASSASSASSADRRAGEDCSWRAALQAGQYMRNPHTTRPTHLGTASGNPEIRHLEQRIDCLATALRIAPAAQLQEILKTFRRCEEQLDSALKEEAAREAEDDNDVHIPGGFGAPSAAPARRHAAAPAAAMQSKKAQADESPMSLFDLSRATARAASRNLAALSSLNASSGGKAPSQTQTPAPKPARTSMEGGDAWGDWGDDTQSDAHSEEHRVRKRDQLREAAMGTLTSGVGWLIGAQPPPAQGNAERERDRGDGW